MFIGQIACEEREEEPEQEQTTEAAAKAKKDKDLDLLSLHLTPINGGTIFFRPKQTILDLLAEEEKIRKKREKEKEAQGQKVNEDSTDDESNDIIGARNNQNKNNQRSLSITTKFDRHKSTNKDDVKKDNIKKWKEYLAEKENEEYIHSVCITRAGTEKSSEVRDTEMICQAQQDRLTEHQTYEEFWKKGKSESEMKGPGSALKGSANSAAQEPDYSKMKILDVFLNKVLYKDPIISIKKLKMFEKEIKRKISDKEVDNFCYKLTATNNSSSSGHDLITIKSVYSFLSQEKSLKKCLETDILRSFRLWFRNVTGNESSEPEMNHRNRK